MLGAGNQRSGSELTQRLLHTIFTGDDVYQGYQGTKVCQTNRSSVQQMIPVGSRKGGAWRRGLRDERLSLVWDGTCCLEDPGGFSILAET